jgi:glyoxylase-like metal-dependent hydrolase (beta-lactamase superfamily II)
MITLAPGLSFCDLRFLDTDGIIAAVVLHGPGGAAIIDPGPSSTLPALRAELGRAGIGLRDVRALLLTHIHLDHAGATGTLVHEQPDLRVYVHENGARHMVDPERLVASATRLWGADMDRLWGEVRPVPSDALIVLRGGERIAAGGRELQVAHTPGHASHHVSYFSEDSGVAFIGDTAGVCLRPRAFVLPPTPPPDIDLAAWRDSLSRIERWRPDTLFVTHFGPHAPTAAHLTEMADHLDVVAGLARTSLERFDDDAAREGWFIEQVRRLLRRRMPEADARAYEVAGRFDLNFRGLARYWTKQATIGSPGPGRRPPA